MTTKTLRLNEEPHQAGSATFLKNSALLSGSEVLMNMPVLILRARPAKQL